ncbi:SNF2 family N-terminal domain-containing protein [Mycena sanguinolenta]|nr:SNF2 family N-terminal domain-containing protein [Mycena sanguinolenta]
MMMAKTRLGTRKKTAQRISKKRRRKASSPRRTFRASNTCSNAARSIPRSCSTGWTTRGRGMPPIASRPRQVRQGQGEKGLACEAAQSRRGRARGSEGGEGDGDGEGGRDERVPAARARDPRVKDYRLGGLQWMVGLHEQGINGILADEMGLGKTLQTIAFTAHLRAKCTRPFLVVGPLSVLHNWCEKFERG